MVLVPGRAVLPGLFGHIVGPVINTLRTGVPMRWRRLRYHRSRIVKGCRLIAVPARFRLGRWGRWRCRLLNNDGVNDVKLGVAAGKKDKAKGQQCGKNLVHGALRLNLSPRLATRRMPGQNRRNEFQRESSCLPQYSFSIPLYTFETRLSSGVTV